MRTTLTPDEDVAAKLKALARRAGLAFRQVVNETLRRGRAHPAARTAREPFKVSARDLGARRPGVGLDNVAELLEQVEGPLHR
jgi:hypothetical protein